MITHSSTFETLAKAPVKQTDVVVARKVTDITSGNVVDDGIITWASSGVLMEVRIDSVGEMLGSATKKATVKLLGIIDTAIVGNLFQVRLGIYNAATLVNAYDYSSVGYFTVDSIDYDYEASSTTIVMYDAMWKAGNTLYTEAVGLNFITYPISVQNFATTIAGILGVTLDTDFSTLPNKDYMILADLYSIISTTTLKNVIQDIAGATGSTAHMTDTVLHFHGFTPITAQTLTSNELKTLKISETYGPITSVVLGRMPQNDNIAINANAPSNNVITAINTTTDVFTLADHGMLAGNMIRLQTTGTLPLPLVANASYYVASITTSTFKLAPTYNDAIAGTNLINITTAGSGTISIPTLQTREIQINNNEILDDDRATLLPPLYNVLSGIDWTDVKADTVGLGWYEVGDVIHFTQGGVTVRAFIAEVHLTLAGSIKEQLISKVPDIASINYAAAGGITKSIYNTEIKVDKQAQEITSVVSRQDTLEGTVNTNFSTISQDVDDVLVTIQRSGGGNLLYNSVGFAKEQIVDGSNMTYDKLLYWTYNTPYTITGNGRATSYSSSESSAAGGISGQVVEMSGTNMLLIQRVTIGANVPLCFGMRIKNTIGTGSAVVTISNDFNSWTAVISSGVTYDWDEIKLENFTTSQPWLDVKIQVTGATAFRYTDLRLMYGATLQGWVQANGEILSANVQFTSDGVRVFDSNHDTETRMTYNEFSTRRKSDNVILFEANDLGVVTNNLSIKGRTSYMNGSEVVVKQLTVPSSNVKAGLAFIKAIN